MKRYDPDRDFIWYATPAGLKLHAFMPTAKFHRKERAVCGAKGYLSEHPWVKKRCKDCLDNIELINRKLDESEEKMRLYDYGKVVWRRVGTGKRLHAVSKRMAEAGEGTLACGKKSHLIFKAVNRDRFKRCPDCCYALRFWPTWWEKAPAVIPIVKKTITSELNRIREEIKSGTRRRKTKAEMQQMQEDPAIHPVRLADIPEWREAQAKNVFRVPIERGKVEAKRHPAIREASQAVDQGPDCGHVIMGEDATANA